MSDHIFLAATMLISLHTEVVCLMSDLLRQEYKLAGQPGKESSLPVFEVLLALLLILALFLYLFTAADMYFTAKYYHFPLVSVLLGNCLVCSSLCVAWCAVVLELGCSAWLPSVLGCRRTRQCMPGWPMVRWLPAAQQVCMALKNSAQLHSIRLQRQSSAGINTAAHTTAAGLLVLPIVPILNVCIWCLSCRRVLPPLCWCSSCSSVPCWYG